MILSGVAFFDATVPTDGISALNVPGHPPMIVVTKQVFYADGKGAWNKNRPPDAIHVALSGITSWTVPVRVKIGVAGYVPWANDPNQYPVPDNLGFWVAIDADGGFQIDSFQVDWLAFWNK